MNQVTLVGRITRNLVLRETNSGKNYVFFTVAVNDLNNQANFINCIAWNRVAENMTKFVGKGSLVAVVGRLTTRKDNKDQYIMEVQASNVSFLDNKKRDFNNENVNDLEQPKTNLQKNSQVNIDEAFQTQNTENYDTEISFVNNNSLDTDDSDDEAIIWD
ncbi:single-stranded DNA-binding protein [Spiroplasma attinicola]|uniref:single-stranded DNA-binding protein n=1 Tax=Spiroplasma attinicola TaxID=2904537 RepID=UPI002022A42C|nr:MULTISPECIES: single-stranded DNA-binding protein [unclassified Spiroplasma]MCL8210205.1 Single-stranded DNA-binding protein [Spiroplasma sp. JKS002670]MCL8210712.1 Single-stranded DNA-binding protein [Spiroplasma sp. JKS002671]